MKRDEQSYVELCNAFSAPKATIARVSRELGVSEASIHRWLRLSREQPDNNEFLWTGEMAPLDVHMRRASKIANERFLAGERPARPLKRRPAPAPEPEPEQVATPEPEPVQAAPAPEPDKPLTALQLDLMRRVEARKNGAPLPPITPPPPRYRSMEDRSEGIGRGEIRPGGVKVA